MNEQEFWKEMRAIKEDRINLEHRESVLLQLMGWENKCNTPGSVWLWHKRLKDGRIISVSQNAALRMQQFMF